MLVIIAAEGEREYYLNMDIKIVAIIVAAVAFGLGLLILGLIGLTYTKKDQALILEKMGQFCEVSRPGWSYRHPFLYRIVGKYSIRSEKAVNKIGNYAVEIDYIIVDVKTFHYSGHCFLDRIVEKMQDQPSPEPAVIKESVLASAQESGIEVTSIEIFKLDDGH